ncbi:MAG: hypothetical protein FGF50_10510, partial [Candidatus Brockarchaeota archaeon]|nr:hypothetical protein [Candidatus Brockarchaeota archaeon]
MSLQTIAQQLSMIATQLSLLAWTLFGVTWIVGSLLKGSPIPLREIKEFGHGLMYDALKAAFWLSMWSTIAAVISWIASLLASGV